jgi:ubiquinone biosynthesis protein UbiJ
MNDEIPIPNPPLTPEEQSAADKLSDMDLQAIDAAILANSSNRWLKVAMVVGRTENALRNKYPALSDLFYAQRVCRLVDEGRLESQGDLLYVKTLLKCPH